MTLLLVNLALAFYLVGAIWAHELDIFRAWPLLDVETFRRVQAAHWRRLPYWVFAPLAAALAGSVALLVSPPPGTPAWAPRLALGLQLVSHALTAATWGRWQAQLSRDPAGAQGAPMRFILRTHKLRAALVSLYGLTTLAWAIACSR